MLSSPVGECWGSANMGELFFFLVLCFWVLLSVAFIFARQCVAFIHCERGGSGAVRGCSVRGLYMGWGVSSKRLRTILFRSWYISQPPNEVRKTGLAT